MSSLECADPSIPNSVFTLYQGSTLFEATVDCDLGYSLIGNVSMICDPETEDWNVLPICEGGK